MEKTIPHNQLQTSEALSTALQQCTFPGIHKDVAGMRLVEIAHFQKIILHVLIVTGSGRTRSQVRKLSQCLRGIQSTGQPGSSHDPDKIPALHKHSSMISVSSPCLTVSALKDNSIYIMRMVQSKKIPCLQHIDVRRNISYNGKLKRSDEYNSRKERLYMRIMNRLLIKYFCTGCSKMLRCKARPLVRNEAYFSVRHNDER